MTFFQNTTTKFPQSCSSIKGTTESHRQQYLYSTLCSSVFTSLGNFFGLYEIARHGLVTEQIKYTSALKLTARKYVIFGRVEPERGWIAFGSDNRSSLSPNRQYQNHLYTRLMLPEEIVLNTTLHVYAAEQWYLRSLIHHFSFPPCLFARWLCSWAGCLCLSYEVCMNLTRRCLEEDTNDHFNHWLQQRSTVESQLRRCRRRVVWCKVWRCTEADRLTKQSPLFFGGGRAGHCENLQVWLFGKIYGENLQEFYGSWCHSKFSV